MDCLPSRFVTIAQHAGRTGLAHFQALNSVTTIQNRTIPFESDFQAAGLRTSWLVATRANGVGIPRTTGDNDFPKPQFLGPCRT